MVIDPNERIYSEIADRFVINHGRTDTPLRMAETICTYERELIAAEAEIARLKAEVDRVSSAGLMYRDTSHLYPHSPRYKKPIPDPLDDEWIKTGREAA